MNKELKVPGRRQFFKDAAALGVIGTLGGGFMLSSCSKSESSKQTSVYEAPVFPKIAPDGELIKAGLIGCGGRGTGAAVNFVNAGPNLQITALADVFQDQIVRCRETLKKNNIVVKDENCFVGFDAYQRLIDSDVDVIIQATATHFRPIHFKAAVEAGKHCFLEKPAAVDPVGIRSVISTGKIAEARKLTVVAGTQRRYQDDYNQTFAMIKNGAIGELISGNCFYNRGGVGNFVRKSEWSDMEAMIRNRANWRWLTGDGVVNLLVHNLDGMNWFFEKYPVKATGTGGRYHRPTGDMYDFFNVDFVFDDNKRYQGMVREISGCTNNISDTILGTKGWTNCQNKIFDYEGNLIWEYQYPIGSDGKPTENTEISPYDQEMICFVNAIRTNNPINQAEQLAYSTLTGIMGRESAYTGLDMKWDDVLYSDLKLGPDKYEWGPVDIKPVSPIPGISI
jgi:myo-inositol 2-dehydrogenase/D-chiro-inositol 1-dehydrogenase